VTTAGEDHVRRSVERGMDALGDTADGATSEIVVSREFDAPPESVWLAITNATQMRKWYFPELPSFAPEVGFRTEFLIRKGSRDFLHQWDVTEVVPGRRIVYRWRFAGLPGDSRVTFELSAEGKATRLTVTHGGLETFIPDVYPELAREDFVEGWTRLIGSSLARFLEGSER
jgi:uncharacterized protein YndB with AHSA1/START domain